MGRGSGAASALAGKLRELETPDAVFQARLGLATRVAEQVRETEPVLAALVVGSTALRRCSVRADLDLVIITLATGGQHRFESRVVDGVRVETELLDRGHALACTTGDGWVWELRQAARLGCSVPVFDTGGFAADLSQRAAAMAPSPGRFESTLRGVYLALIELGREQDDPFGRADALRGCLDNLALLALLERPRRYQKAKWALADLLHVGEEALVEAMLDAYAAHADDGASARSAVTGARDVIDRAFVLAGAPPHETMLAMGHAPELAEASYVSRCLDDAVDLEASGRFVEAQYVAKFAARLAAGLLSAEVPSASFVDTLAASGGTGLATCYVELFRAAPDPTVEQLEAALAAADGRQEALDDRHPVSEALA